MARKKNEMVEDQITDAVTSQGNAAPAPEPEEYISETTRLEMEAGKAALAKSE